MLGQLSQLKSLLHVLILQETDLLAKSCNFVKIISFGNNRGKAVGSLKLLKLLLKLVLKANLN